MNFRTFSLMLALALLMTGGNESECAENTNGPAGYRAGELPWNGGAVDFPELPPDPNLNQEDWLPPVEEELDEHAGSQLYEPEGDPAYFDHSHERLRLPEDWQEPRPLTGFADFLGADPVYERGLPPFRSDAYAWEPRFVGYGGYQVFGFALEQNNRRQEALGHQLILDLDLQLTGTERFHVQFRPLGRQNTGGSYYQFSDPEGYVDNSTLQPDRYWFEAELHSLLGFNADPLARHDINFVVGRFPLRFHNGLLLNADLLGLVVSQNTIYGGDLSNMNVQLFSTFDGDQTFTDGDANRFGANISLDIERIFYEATYAYLQHTQRDDRSAHYLALSRTQFIGAYTLAARGMVKLGDEAGRGSGELFVLEANRTAVLCSQPLGIEKAVVYSTAFYAGPGWSSLGGGNFNRLRSSFEVNPLVRISAAPLNVENWGATLGVQLFRDQKDESWIPEIAYQAPDGQSVLGCGMRYQRRLTRRAFLDVLGVVNFSDDPRFDREGIFASTNWVF